MTKEALTLYGKVAVMVVSLGGFLFGFHLGVISGVLTFLPNSFSLSVSTEGLIVSLLLIGASIGALSGGFLADRFGRKKTIIATAVIFTLGAAICTMANRVDILIIGRFIAGLGVGLISVAAPLYLSEVAPPKQRGAIVCINQLAGVIGIFFSYLVVFFFSKTGDWRAMFAVGMAPSLFLMFAMLFFPDTPEWLLAHQTKAAATSALKRLRKDLSWKSHFDEMKVAASPQKDSSWRHLFKPDVRFALIVGVTLSILQQITGINGVIYFAPKIFATAGYDLATTATLATVGIGAINVIATSIAVKLLDRAGRRPLLLVGCAGMAVALLVLVFAFYFQLSSIGVIALVSLLSYVGFFAIGLGPVPWLFLSEIYPLSIRGKAMSVGITANWFFNFVIAQTFLDLILKIGSEGVFFLFAVLSVFAFFFIRRYVPETKGKSLEEIELHFSQLKNRS